MEGAHQAAHEMFHRFVGGMESGLLEANKLAAQFGLWLGHPNDKEDLETADRLQKEYEAAVEAETKAGAPTWPRVAGEIADPLNFIPTERALGGAGWLANVGRGALGGMKGALFTPSTGTDEGREKLKQVAEGAAAGGVLGGAIPDMTPEAKLLTNEGVRLTPGMKVSPLRRPEEAARSLPIMGQAIGNAERVARDDLNRAIYNRVLEPIGQTYGSGPVGNAGVDSVRARLTVAYDRALQGTRFLARPPGQVPFGLNPSNLADLNNILALMTRERRQQFNQIINQFYGQRVPANGIMDGETFKRVESELSEHARRFLRSNDPDQHAVGEAVDEVVSLLRDAHAVQNPQKAAELQRVNRAFRRYIVLERGALTRTTSNGVMTPSDFLSSLRATDSSVRRNRFARGRADMQDLAQAANTVMTPHLGQSGTAERSFMIDMAALGAGGYGAHYMGVPPDRIGEFIAGLVAGSTPYLRRSTQGATANIGSRAAAALAPGIQAAAPAAGVVVAQP
jgi:hypothetical protein